MIFIEKLKEKEKVIEREFERLIEIAFENQSHPGDLLLLTENGFYDENTIKINELHGKNWRPHSIGIGTIGLSESTHYLFIDQYRNTNISKFKYEDYLKLVEFSSERKDEIDELEKSEAIGVQLEMLIYLKFWEADLILKRLYQFVRIINGEVYDWFFKVNNLGNSNSGTGSRKVIITSKIRDKIKVHSQIIYDLINETYKPQIRNSIAHSNYSIFGRHIQLNNSKDGGSNKDLFAVSFNEWIEIFENTMILYNQYIRLNNVLDTFYADFAISNKNEMEIRIIERDNQQFYTMLEYRPEFKHWSYKVNLE